MRIALGDDPGGRRARWLDPGSGTGGGGGEPHVLGHGHGGGMVVEKRWRETMESGMKNTKYLEEGRG